MIYICLGIVTGILLFWFLVPPKREKVRLLTDTLADAIEWDNN